MSTRGGLASAQFTGKVSGKVFQGETKTGTSYVSFRLSYERPARGSGESKESTVNCSYFGNLKYANGIEKIREGDWLSVAGEPYIDFRESGDKKYYDLAVRVQNWNRVLSSAAAAVNDDDDDEDERPAPRSRQQSRKPAVQDDEDSAGSPFED